MNSPFPETIKADSRWGINRRYLKMANGKLLPVLKIKVHCKRGFKRTKVLMHPSGVSFDTCSFKWTGESHDQTT